MKQSLIGRFLITIALIIATAFTLFPILWTLITSFKTDLQMFSIPPEILPDPPTIKHYREVLTSGSFFNYFHNSLVVAICSISVTILASIPAAYGFARFGRNKAKKLFGVVTAVRMIPQVAMVIPYFLMIRYLRLSDNLLALILVYIPFEMALVIWILKNFFSQIPLEIEEAAEIDGLGPLGRLIHIVIPLSKSSIGVAVILAFQYSWNEFMFALSLTSTSASQTLTIGIASNVTSFQTFWGNMSAMAILFMIPILVVTAIFQKDLVKGLTAGAVKG